MPIARGSRVVNLRPFKSTWVVRHSAPDTVSFEVTADANLDGSVIVSWKLVVCGCAPKVRSKEFLECSLCGWLYGRVKRVPRP